MSISQIIEKYHKNRVENIRKMSNGIDRDMAIGSFVADLGKGSIKQAPTQQVVVLEKLKNAIYYLPVIVCKCPQNLEEDTLLQKNIPS